MNWKQIIRAAFDLTDEEWDQAVKLRELGEADRGLLMERLGPQKPAARKSSKKAGKKSTRAQSLGEQLRQRQTIKGNAAICTDCDYGSDHNIHHLESMTGHHPFQPAVPSAPPPSDQAVSEKAAAGHVAGGSSE